MTEDTIEEKVVERAQQKLKLDAMVVQRGMLQGEKKLEKDEMLAAIRYSRSGIALVLLLSCLLLLLLLLLICAVSVELLPIRRQEFNSVIGPWQSRCTADPGFLS